MLKEYLEHVVGLSSCTAATHLALNILGVQKGDKVICSTFTFVASCNPIIYHGVTPILINSELETWNMGPVLLESAIKERMLEAKDLKR
ncbi:MAG: DegT/DnrJ/EryC1/StrS family aminotransferase [Bacteroidota bacterium]